MVAIGVQYRQNAAGHRAGAARVAEKAGIAP
jgi:hypothetical protein